MIADVYDWLELYSSGIGCDFSAAWLFLYNLKFVCVCVCFLYSNLILIVGLWMELSVNLIIINLKGEVTIAEENLLNLFHPANLFFELSGPCQQSMLD